ncbi:MAG: carboxymuconolactone decarboxylase family protein [Cyanobacteria bacterium SZAS LIN-2]|nr:carboxymuconolactone decarboxylase family protein [Cyanobacteria bacterium SZAS LIN-3]MBS1996687.1 carboxymuconolactone decarboxylase family protein [Cyanobacteria bacterium SZAS LIN-2]
MQNIAILEKNQASAEAQVLLGGVERQLGMIPNLFLTVAHSPAALKGYMQFSGALTAGKLSPKLREQIALATAGRNHCDYCASAHTLLGGKAGLQKDELELNLTGCSNDAKTSSALKFVVAVVEKRGEIEKSTLEDLVAAGFSDEEVVEIIAHIALNIFTNYFNHIAGTEIDFPLVTTKVGSTCS